MVQTLEQGKAGRMSVLIKDMKMPKSCNSCDLLQDYDGDMYCPLNSYLNFGDIENVPDYVMDSCPLSEVPERKTGKWIYNSPVTMKCNLCGLVIKDWDWNRFDFCPACGVDMRGNQDENN